MCSYHLAWTNATRCCMASRTGYADVAVNSKRSTSGQCDTIARPHHVGVTQAALVPVQQRMKFKVACLAFTSRASQVPEYLSSDCRLVSAPLWSADSRNCVVPRTHNRHGDRSFSVPGPQQWNTLPMELDRSFSVSGRLSAMEHSTNVNTCPIRTLQTPAENFSV